MPNPVFQDGPMKQEVAQKHGSGSAPEMGTPLVEGEKGKALFCCP